MVRFFVIDFSDKKSAVSCRRALLRLKSTVDCDEPVQYSFGGPQQEHFLCVHSTKTEEELDDWLYSVKASGDYIGVTEKSV